MKRLVTTTMATVAFALIGAPALAQDAPLSASSPDAPTPLDYGQGRDFWRGAPATVGERLMWLDLRVQHGIRDGSITQDEAARVTLMLQQTRAVHERLLARDHGQLTARDTLYMQHRLNNMSSQIRWARDNGVDGHKPD